MKIPTYCFTCGAPLKEIGLGALECTKCVNGYIPYEDNDGNQCLSLVEETKYDFSVDLQMALMWWIDDNTFNDRRMLFNKHLFYLPDDYYFYDLENQFIKEIWFKEGKP